METLEEWLVKELTKRHASITTAESCTGGLVSGRIVPLPCLTRVLSPTPMRRKGIFSE